jgi:hypothetical protein
MLNYELKEQYIRVKWKKKELGRIYHESYGWVYRPKGCEGRIESESFQKLDDLKHHLEHDDTQSV